jgi:hypothetical protein
LFASVCPKLARHQFIDTAVSTGNLFNFMKLYRLFPSLFLSRRSISFGLRSILLGFWVSAGAATATAAVPVIVSSPANQLATEGTNAQLTVIATGADTLHYQWKRDGVSVGADSATLTVAPVQATDQGEYLVSVSNSAGAVVSAPAFLYTEPAVPAFAQNRLEALSADTLAANKWTPDKIPGYRQQVMDAQLNGVGRVWQNIAPGFGNVIYDLRVDDGVITLILDLGGLVQSTDGGKSWKTVSYQLPGNGNYQGFFLSISLRPTLNS